MSLFGMTKKNRALASTFIRAWRKHRGLSLSRVVDRLANLHDLGITKTSLSRIETGKQPYSQPILEALADVLETDVASLLMRDPGQPDMIWSIWDRIAPPKRDDARRILEALADKEKKKAG